MSAFNSVRVSMECPACGKVGPRVVQFKFADCWQYEYEVGDIVRWAERRNVGQPALRKVVAVGTPNECLFCGDCPDTFEVWVELDKIVKVCPDSGRFDFVHSSEPYIVVEH